jgi:hypothetical protein
MQPDDRTTSFWQDTAGDAEQQRGQGGEGERHSHAQEAANTHKRKMEKHATVMPYNTL